MAVSGLQHSEAILIDEQTFEQAYRLHWRMVYGICFHYSHDPEASRELVQEIFESLWKRKDHLQIHGPLENYLSVAAKLAVFNYLRNNKSGMLLSIDDSMLAQYGHESTEQQVLAGLLSEEIVTISGQLPEKSREVFDMSRNQGLSNKQISAVLSVSENTVKYHITYALRFFRDRLKEFV